MNVWVLSKDESQVWACEFGFLYAPFSGLRPHYKQMGFYALLNFTESSNASVWARDEAIDNKTI